MSNYPPNERLEDLLTERALFGLPESEQQELAALLAENDFDASAFDEIAAITQLASVSEQPFHPLPTALGEKIVSAATTAQQPPSTTPSRRERPSGTDSFPWTGWLMIAASILFAAFIFSRQPDAKRPEQSPPELRRELLAESKLPDSKVLRIDWTRGDDPTAENASGEVLWDSQQQSGVMRFRGLAANDPTKHQYQLWIFDAQRDERYPVDGGVFNIDDAQGETLVPIDARLPVSEATLFAITVEPPGGVVVSSRKRLPLLAAVGAAK